MILIADDDAFFRTFCSEVLTAKGHVVHTASSAQEALDVLDREGANLILADIYMPGMTGLELLESVKARDPSVDVVIMTGYGSIDTAIQALKRGAADYLRKPFAAEELEAVVEATLAQRRLYEENQRLKRQLRFYEISKSFSSIDDPARVLELALEALCRVSEAGHGLCLHSATGFKYMALLHSYEMEKNDAQAIRESFVTRGLRYLRKVEQAHLIGKSRLAKILGDSYSRELSEALLVPLQDRSDLDGVFILFRCDNSPKFSKQDAENALFIGRQAELSYNSAKRIQEARQLALVDSLTDLYNSRYLETAIEKNIAESDKLGLPFSVLFMDLDYFKEINDEYGHLTGGRVLVEVSRIIKTKVREEDILIRYGGDEFTMVLPRTESEGARDVAERIRQAIKAHLFLGREGLAIRITASIGVATYPQDAKNREELIEQADHAMYRSKEATRDAVYVACSH